jgi:hypothetical protein
VLRTKHVLWALTLTALLVFIYACTSASPGGGPSTISGSATAQASYYGTMLGTPTVELQQGGVVKYTLVLGSIADGWSLSPTQVLKGTYDLHIVVQNTFSPPTVGTLMVNAATIDTSGMTYSYSTAPTGGAPYTGDALVPGLVIGQDADVEVTLQSIPW